MKRNIEAVLAVILKLLFIYDILYLVIIKPLEKLFYKRLSSSLILSSGNTLHMSFDFSELFVLRKKRNTVKKLLTIKSSFLTGLEKLEYVEDQKYYTYVNEVFYLVLIGDKKLENQGISSQTISTEVKNQTEAKLLLLKSTDVWQELLSNNRRKFLKFLMRKEKILKIEFQKIKKE